MQIRQFNENRDKTRVMTVLEKVLKELNPSMTMSEEQFDAMLKVEGDLTVLSRDCLVAEDDNSEIIGFIGLLKSSKRDFWHLEMALLTEYVSSNISVELIESILNLAKKQNAPEIRFTTVKAKFKNTPLEDKFKKMGLEPVNYNWWMRLDDIESVPESKIPLGITLQKNVLNDAFSEHFDFSPYKEEEFKIRQLAAWKDKFNKHWLAFEENKLIGFCSVVINPGQKHVGMIDILGVLHSYHHRGIGSSLLGIGVKSLIENGCTIIELAVEAKNEKALNLYKKFGFNEMESLTRIFYTIHL
jgi:mycothiol synthase